MKKTAFLIIALMCFGLGSMAQKFAYVNTDYILEKIPEYTQAQKQIEQLSAQWQKEIEAIYTDIDQLYKDYIAEKVLLTDEMRKEREDIIIAKEKEAKSLQKQRFGPEGDLYKKRQELVKPIQDQVFNAVQQVAQKRKLDIVFDKSSELMMLYTNQKYDISDDVLDKMGYRY